MKKITMIVFFTVMVAVLSGCTTANASVEITYPSLSTTLDVQDEEAYRFELEEETIMLDEPETITRDGVAAVSGGASWLYAKVQDGVQGTKTVSYMVAYNRDDEMLSRIEIPENDVTNSTTPTIYSNNQVAKPGAYYTSSRVTRYGYDCAGCNQSDNRGGTAAGIAVGNNEVRQSDGTWQTGVTYEGYYLIATAQDIPFCTVVEVTNHTVSGSGITPGVPFKAIVVDRGGSITGSKTDLFIGSESNPMISMGSKKTFDVQILEMHNRTRVNGVWGCGV
ncbi:hypothetical protein AOC36_00175 [Erysipelothrix larvae]|uniref:3D domain-containing protein n=1 Tax=Erysipelothrix larvae TaxID=1514105 RepID=A0A109UGF3_9FIRM|nr:hypothetical protein [Erysipelothrix larvae]AMC92463.1 hypothetical protein AOC36_00175 [Erysipelothrix larvae]